MCRHTKRRGELILCSYLCVWGGVKGCVGGKMKGDGYLDTKVPGVSKTVWCRKLQYFTNGAIYHCDILRHGTYNFHLCMGKISIQYIKGNYSYDHEKNGGSKWTWIIKYACV